MKNNKLLLSIGTFVSSIGAIATIVSCGGNLTGVASYARYDTKFDKEINITTTWADTGHQYKALIELVKKYNVENKDKEGFVKVKVTYDDRSYGKYIQGIYAAQLRNKADNIANIVIDYPESLGILAAAGQELDLAKVKLPSENSTKKIKDLIDPKFAKVNDRIGGLKQGGVYSTPVAFSGQMISIDGPALSRVFDAIEKNGGTVNVKGKKLLEIKDKLDSWKDENIVGLNKINSAKAKSVFKDYTVSDETFKSWEGLIEFSKKVASAYGINAKSEMKIVGIDDGATTFYELAYGKSKNKMSDFTFHTGKDGYVNYDNATNENTKWAQNKIVDLINSGGTWIGGHRLYGSSQLLNHKMIFSIGSSAGWTHTFLRSGAKIYTISKTEDADKSEIGKTLKVYKYSPIEGDENYIIGIGKKKDGKYKKGKKIKKSELVKMSKDKSASLSKDGWLSKEKNAMKVKGAFKVTKKYYFIPESSITPKTDYATVQESESFHLAAPLWSKKSHNDEKALIFKNGPSFIPIHNNSSEDIGTAMFIKWFYSNKALMNEFAKETGYIVPYNGYTEHLSDLKKGNKLIGDLVNSFANKSDKYEIFQTPIDETTGPFRDMLISGIRALYTTAHTKGKVDENRLINEIKSYIKKA